ncbi:MAG: hypothetical protein QOI14_607 [Actinomycetota bacterium]|nr:hypothetical protein [Actinomycetota bacterium]
MALSRERAATALTRVESDPAALATFLAAYSGDEDAVPALREAADPTVASAASLARAARMAEYERAAYGRTNTPDEEAVAANARDEIVWEEDHRAAISAALEAAVAALDPAGPAANAPSASAASTDPEPAPAARKRFRFTVPVVVAVAIVGIVVGAIIATGAGRQPGSTGSGTSTPSATAVPIGGSVTRTYTADQVSGWFSATATGADTFPRLSYLTSIGLNNDSTRFIATSATGWSLWVGKSTTGQTCLLLNGTIKTPTRSLSSCLPSAAIAQGKAIVINAHGINATLTRNDLVVAITGGDQGP